MLGLECVTVVEGHRSMTGPSYMRPLVVGLVLKLSLSFRSWEGEGGPWIKGRAGTVVNHRL